MQLRYINEHMLGATSAKVTCTMSMNASEYTFVFPKLELLHVDPTSVLYMCLMVLLLTADAVFSVPRAACYAACDLLRVQMSCQTSDGRIGGNDQVWTRRYVDSYLHVLVLFL